MGSTCASVHLLWGGDSAIAVKAIGRAYAKLGYERLKKQPTESGKHVIVLERASERFVSVYDSTNADLDGGELKDAALEASRLLKTGAVFTSLYDSDNYEFILFNNGRQVDLLMTDAESYSGPLKQLGVKARATQWSRIFARPLTQETINQAAGLHTAFANDTLAALCGLIGLAGDRPQIHYQDFKDEPESIAASLYFSKKAAPRATPTDGRIVLKNYFDRDNSRKLLVYPASWPMPVEREEILTWLMLSEGAGFTGGTATVKVIGPDGLNIRKGFISGVKFHNGQIVGDYELAKNATPEEAEAYLESKHFTPSPAAVAPPGASAFAAEYPSLWVPPTTQGQTTQILVILQLYVSAIVAGEWTVSVTLRPGAQPGEPHALPPARVAAVRQSWIPVVTGLNPKTTYDLADRIDERPPDRILDSLIQQSQDWRYAGMTPAEARASLAAQQAQGHERSYKTWLHDVINRQKDLTASRLLDYPAIASNVVILRDGEQATLDLCRSHLESWLRPLAGNGGEIRLRATRQMTENLYVGKVKKTWPTEALLADKAWAKFFDYAQDYQSVVLDLIPAGAEFPVAGMGLHYALRDRTSPTPAKPNAGADDIDYNEYAFALTLAKMRGHEIAGFTASHTVHLFTWVINHGDTLRYLGTSLDAMKARLDALAVACPTLQAWHGTATWIPVFDLADGWEETCYEAMSVLNFFRGILLEQHCALKDRWMTAQWCANVLRMVTPHMWLCNTLARQLDLAALRKVAAVADINGSCKIEKLTGCAMEDFELALLPILPIESARLTVKASA